MGYLTVAEFKVRTVMPQADVDTLEVSEPGFLQQTLDDWSEEIDSRLAKRYAVPFKTPAPRVVKRWLVSIVSPIAYDKRGWNPQQDQAAIREDAKTAKEEIKEAAEAEKGLFELPLIAGSEQSGVVRGGPFGYSEISPYVWADIQRANAEDRQ